jgi:hypothetical protein
MRNLLTLDGSAGEPYKELGLEDCLDLLGGSRCCGLFSSSLCGSSRLYSIIQKFVNLKISKHHSDNENQFLYFQ